MHRQHTKQANIGKILASLGLGGLIGGGIGHVSGYNSGNRAGYAQGSANASKDTLINLLKGMTGVVQQGAESKLDLKKLFESKSGEMPSIPVAPIKAASIKTARLRRVLDRMNKKASFSEKTSSEKQAIAAMAKQIMRLLGKPLISKAEQQASKFSALAKGQGSMFAMPKAPEFKPPVVPAATPSAPLQRFSPDIFETANPMTPAKAATLEKLRNARLIPQGGWPEV
jgi:hypothetical protein